MDMGGHDHGDMAMTGMSATSTGTAMPAATSAAASGSHSAMGGCKISMLWNWNTIDSCFIARTWHVTTKGMFAGSCIGVICLGICLELIRRSVKEYDRFLLRQHRAKFLESSAAAAPAAAKAGEGSDSGAACVAIPAFRPNVFQQAIRAFLHMVQFAVAYFLMLLAMYYNGYIIICIFIGTYIGSFIFQWETLVERRTSAANEATVCCG